MHTLDMRDKAIATAKSLGYEIRQEWLDGQGGGLCEVAGRRILFIDQSQTPMEQLEVVLDALREDRSVETSTIPLPIQTLLGSKKAA